MGVAYNPKLITNGLSCCIDPMNRKCFVSGATSAYDLSLNRYVYSVNNTPVLSGGGMLFDSASSQYLAGNITTSQKMTVITIAKGTASTWNHYGILGSSRQSNGYIFHTVVSSKNIQLYFYNSAGSPINYTTIAADDITVPVMYTMSTDGVNNHRAYINDKMVSSSGGGLARNDINYTVNNSLARDDGLARYGNVTIYYHAIYNRQLSDDEVAQIYNTFKVRFGL